jgi:hypothetical protein
MTRRVLFCLTAAILLGVVVYTGLRAFLGHQVDGQLQSVASATPVLDAIDYTRLEIQLAPPGIALRDVTLKPSGPSAPLTVRRATLSDYRPGRPLPHRFSLALENLSIAATHPAVAPFQALLRDLGLTHLDMDLHLRMEKRPAQANAWQGHLELQVEEAGTWRLMLAVDNLNIEGVRQALENPHLWWAVLPPVGIQALAAEFEDGGLVERIVAAQARHDGGSPAAARRRLRASVEAVARQERIFPLGLLLTEFIAAPVRIGYYNGNTEPVRLGHLLWSRRFGDWCHALQVAGYRAASPRETSWITSTGLIPGKPPRR